MKSTNKILLILASAALLASCGGTSSSTVPSSEASSSSETSSSELSSSEESSSSEPEFEPMDPVAGKAALLAAVGKSVDNDAIALHLNASGVAGIDGTVTAQEVSSSVMPIDGTFDGNAALAIDIAVSGLKSEDANELKAAASIAGEVNFQATTAGAPVGQQSSVLDSACYISEGKQYLNIDEATASLMQSAMGWPYGAGKLRSPEGVGIPDGFAPLINETVVAQAVAGIESELEQAELVFGESLGYYSDGETDKIALELDAAAIKGLFPLFGMPEEMIPAYTAILEKIDIEACGLEITFDETGLLGLGLAIDATGTLSPLMMDPTLPASMAEETFDAEIHLGIAGTFEYGENVEVVLPDDLDQYEIVEPQGAGSSSQGSESYELLDMKQVAEMAEGFQDMDYNALTMTIYMNDSKAGEQTITSSDENWDAIANLPLYHIQSGKLGMFAQLPEGQFKLVDGHLRFTYVATGEDDYGETVTTTTIDYDSNGYATHLVAFTDSQNDSADIRLEYTISWGYAA